MLPKMPDVLTGSVCAQRVRCSRPNCHCKSGATLHGPYFYHFWREDGRLKKRYLKPDEVEATRAACEKGKAARRRRADYRKAFRAPQAQALHGLMREIEAMLKEAKAHE
jgi:hypothetical protein